MLSIRQLLGAHDKVTDHKISHQILSLLVNHICIHFTGNTSCLQNVSSISSTKLLLTANPCKAKRQYLITLKMSRYHLLALLRWLHCITSDRVPEAIACKTRQLPGKIIRVGNVIFIPYGMCCLLLIVMCVLRYVTLLEPTCIPSYHTHILEWHLWVNNSTDALSWVLGLTTNCCVTVGISKQLTPIILAGRAFPANTAHSPNVGSMLGQRLRRWSNIKTALG